jgi:hypothetical protein
MHVLLFLLLGVSYTYFTQYAHNSNVICRGALAANIVQHGRIDINGYEKTNTEDISFYGGNYFCDKAPGMSFLALPAAFAFTRVLPVSADIAQGEGVNKIWGIFLYLCTISTSGLFAALGGVMLFRYLIDRTGDLYAALIGSLTFGLGTPIWGWATSFFSHATAAALLLIGFILLDRARRLVVAGKHAGTFAALAGLALGVATAVEYTSLVAAVLIGACIAAVCPWRSHARQILAMFTISGVAAFCALVPVLIYHNAAFGSPFTPGYTYAVVYEATRNSGFGVAMPDFSRMAELLAGGRRGLIWISPVMIAAAWSLVVSLRRPETRMPAVAATLVMAWFLVFNAGYTYWLAGATAGPRYLTPAAAMLALPLGLAWPSFGRWERRLTLGLLGISIAVNLVCTAVNMSPPEALSNPLTQSIWPLLINGHVKSTMIFKLTGHDGLLDLVPWLAISTVLGWLLWREVRRGALLPAVPTFANVPAMRSAPASVT